MTTQDFQRSLEGIRYGLNCVGVLTPSTSEWHLMGNKVIADTTKLRHGL